MKRQIEFRGRGVHGGEWYYGSLYIQEPPLQCFEIPREEDRRYFIVQSGFADWNMERPQEQHEVFPETVGQFINQFDKNHKKIYEHDILKTNEVNWIAKVIWNYDGFMLTGLDNCGFSCDPAYKECEVIGNIYARN